MSSYSRFQKTCAHISRDRPQENNGHHYAEENNDHDRVNNAEPMYSWVKNVQVIIPTGSLGDVSITSNLKSVVHVPMGYLIPNRVSDSIIHDVDMVLTSQVTR